MNTVRLITVVGIREEILPRRPSQQESDSTTTLAIPVVEIPSNAWW